MDSEVILILCVLSLTSRAIADSTGKEFIFSFPDYGYADQFTIAVTAEESGEMTIDIPYLNSNTKYQLNIGSKFINMSTVLASDKLAIRKKAIHITSTVDISLHALQVEYVSDYSFLILPVHSLSNSYIVTSFASTGDPADGSQSYVTVTALEDKTHVNLTLPSVINTSRSVGPIRKDVTKADRQLVTAELNKNEILNFAFNGDLTGTLVVSNNPVYVTSGSSNVIIPKRNNSNFDWRQQNVISTVFPTSLWQKRFIVTPFLNQAGYLVRVTASVDNTKLQITSESNVVIKKAGDFYDIIVNQTVPIYILSDQPVSVVQFTLSTNFRMRSDKDGGNVMMSVPAIEQYVKGAYHFTLPIWSPDTRDKLYNYIAIMIQTDQVSCLRLDGVYPYLNGTMQTLTVDDKNYNIITTELKTSGYHNLRCNDTSVPFGAVIYGFSAANGFGYPILMKY